MMCEKCGKNLATTHIKTVINGAVNEKNLCAFCAAKEGYSSFDGHSLSNMLAQMLYDTGKEKSLANGRCKCCGASFSDIAESGKVGCSECYENFKEELIPTLNRLHGKVKHIGRTPSGSAEEKDNLDEKISKLREKLNAAVEKEEFEKAAKLRDEIKLLEKEEL